MIVLPAGDRRDLIGLIAVCAGIGASVGLGVEGVTLPAARDAAVMAGLAPYAFTLTHIALNSGSERSRWVDLLAVASLVHVPSLCITSATTPRSGFRESLTRTLLASTRRSVRNPRPSWPSP